MTRMGRYFIQTSYCLRAIFIILCATSPVTDVRDTGEGILNRSRVGGGAGEIGEDGGERLAPFLGVLGVAGFVVVDEAVQERGMAGAAIGFCFFEGGEEPVHMGGIKN